MMARDRPSVTVAILTPFDRDGRVDIDALRAHVRFLAERGVDAVMTAGTTGEGALLDSDEVLAVTTIAAQADSNIPILAHVGRPGTESTIDLGSRALDAGAAAVVAVVPYYHRLTDQQILRHFRALIARCSPERVFAYSIPSLTVNDLVPESARALAAEGIAGIKDSTKSFPRHLEYLRAVGGLGRECAVYMGSDEMVLQSLRAGSAGAVSALANCAPDLLISLRDAFLDGRQEDADRLQEELSEMRVRLSRGPSLTRMKRETARVLEEVGISYPVYQRAPLG